MGWGWLLIHTSFILLWIYIWIVFISLINHLCLLFDKICLCILSYSVLFCLILSYKSFRMCCMTWPDDLHSAVDVGNDLTMILRLCLGLCLMFGVPCAMVAKTTATDLDIYDLTGKDVIVGREFFKMEIMLHRTWQKSRNILHYVIIFIFLETYEIITGK